jgi:hypothetical protein
MTYWYTLFPILIATTAAIAVRHGFIPPLGSFPAWATNLTGGALVGAVLAAAVGLAFSQGTAVRVAEGCLLGGGLVAGLPVGSVLKEPLLSSVRVGGKGGPPLAEGGPRCGRSWTRA